MEKTTIMVIILLLSLSVLQVSGTDYSDSNNFFVLNDDKIIIRIYYENDDVFIPKNCDVISKFPGDFVDVLIDKSELEYLIRINLNFSIIKNEYMNQMLNGKYHKLDEMESILMNISQDYPDITKLFSIGLSYENRNIWCLEISDNPGNNEDEPGILIMGVHHAREWPTMEICLNIADQLTINYGISENITDLVNNRRIWIVTCVNPDGYYFDYDLNGGDQWWRKNRKYFPNFKTYGVDLNRNYAGSCNGDIFGMWGSSGMSHNPENSVFCGFDIFSESETQAIRDFIINNEICAVLSYHTYGELVMWPWGYSTNSKTPDDQYLSQIGTEIALRITNQDKDGTYTPTQAAGLYPTTGDTCDWVYGYGNYVLGRSIFPFTIEACESFHPTEDVLEQVCQENYEGAIYLIKEAENISNLNPRVIPPIFTDIQFSEEGDYLLNWIEKNPEANVEYFQLDELEEFEMIFDDSETENELWNLSDFIVTDDKFNSISSSYKSHTNDNHVSSMTTNYPLPIFDDTSISFWCFFDIEEYYDMAFFEVSKDGRMYDVVDTFTGKSRGWIFKNYDLTEYDGESIFLRFRYSTDDYTHGKGFYVDDIYPIPIFNKITVLSDNLNSNNYEIKNKSDGIYYYRLRGFNSIHEWGDYSIIKRVVNQFDYNKPPSPPIISGRLNGKSGDDYEYSFISNDVDDSEIYYYIDWGDGINTEWIGPYESGELIYLNHTWNDKGEYTIRAKSKDLNNVESYWSTLEISMPLNKLSNILLFKFNYRVYNILPFSILTNEKILYLFD